MLRIAVCDDCRQLNENLSEMLYKFFMQMGINCYIDLFLNGEELIMAVDCHGIYDIIFLDIEMNGINGIETARYLKSRYPAAVFIFVSSYSCYYADAFDVQPFHYLLKPVNPKQLYGVLLRLCNYAYSDRQILSFDFNRIHYRINAADILYLESRKRVIYVICENVQYQFYGKLAEAEDMLSECNMIFLRIHASFLVSMRYVSGYQANRIYMTNGDILPVSASRRIELKKLAEKDAK